MMKVLTAVAVSLATAGMAHAEWPEKPIKVVVPFNPGGTSDQVSRAFTTAIQENDILPQPLNIINVGGGHFSIGARQVLDAEPDGYTFLTLHIALMGAEAGGMLDFSYRDFEPVATTGEFCLVPMVRKEWASTRSSSSWPRRRRSPTRSSSASTSAPSTISPA